ncbi:MAG: M48 family peptidase, partial [Roseivirga sp.]|nr:M48 family peptidase [Roseivirga sp.]
MNPNEWLYLILGIVVVDYVIDQLLDFLNFKHSKTAVPDKLKDLYDEEEYARSQAYQKARSRFGFLTSAFSTLLTMVVLLFGGFGVLDEFLRAYIENPILLSLAFFGVLFILSDIVNTPFSLYSTFVIEERFGFNKTTVKTFVMDKLKGYLLTVIVGGVLGYALLWIVHQLGDNFWLYALALVSAFMLIMNLFYTSLILPIFNKLKPL